MAGYFGLQSLIGSRIYPLWKRFLEWEHLSKKELNERVDERLGRLLDHAVQSVEFYSNLGLRRRAGETAQEFLKRFPELRRVQLRDSFQQLIVDSLRPEIPSPTTPSPKRFSWLIVKTGGTTGTPTTVVHDALFRDSGRVTRIYAQRLCGFPLGTPFFRLWGSEADLLQQKENLDRRVMRGLMGEIPLNAFRAKADELAAHYEAIRSRPGVRHLMTYVDAAASFAQFLQDKKLPPPNFDGIMACAGTVTPEWRRLLKEVFSAEIFDKYGSRECADMACECRAHDGLHIFSPHVFLEVVDDDGKPCEPGQRGRVLVTLLPSFGFPLIRYEIGDLAILDEPAPCPCGLPFPKVQSLQGRQDDMLVTEDGTLLSSVFIRHFVGVSLNQQLIREWQLEQAAPGRFTFRYVPLAREGLQANLASLHGSFRSALGESSEVAMEEVSEIAETATGKIRWIVNRSSARPVHS